MYLNMIDFYCIEDKIRLDFYYIEDGLIDLYSYLVLYL